MKKIFTVLLLVCFTAVMSFALSYDDNEYQVKSREYSALAEKAFNEGRYEESIEYSKQAEEYAQKSYEYIQSMLARTQAEDEMNRARTRFTWAKNNKADTKYPGAFALAAEALDAGALAFDNGQYDVAVVCAKKVLDALSVVEGYDKAFPEDKALANSGKTNNTSGNTQAGKTSTGSSNQGASSQTYSQAGSDIPSDYQGLPKYYVVRTFRGEKDCLWNIAQNPLVYNDPYKWTVLYDANKSRLPDPNNPNWVEPGTILEIPSIKGESRSGTYNPGPTTQSSQTSSSNSSPSITVTVTPTAENPVTVEVNTGTEGTISNTSEGELE